MVDRAEGRGVTQLAEIHKRWQRGLGSGQTDRDAASFEADRNHAPPR